MAYAACGAVYHNAGRTVLIEGEDEMKYRVSIIMHMGLIAVVLSYGSTYSAARSSYSSSSSSRSSTTSCSSSRQPGISSLSSSALPKEEIKIFNNEKKQLLKNMMNEIDFWLERRQKGSGAKQPSDTESLDPLVSEIWSPTDQLDEEVAKLNAMAKKINEKYPIANIQSFSAYEIEQLKKAITAYVGHALSIKKFRAKRQAIFDAIRKDATLSHDQKVKKLNEAMVALHAAFVKPLGALPPELWAIIDAELPRVANPQVPLEMSGNFPKVLAGKIGSYLDPQHIQQALLYLFGWQQQYVTPAGTELGAPYPVDNGARFFACGLDGRIYVYERQGDGFWAGRAVTPIGIRFGKLHPVDNGARLFAQGMDDGRIYVLEHQEDGFYAGRAVTPVGTSLRELYPADNGERFFVRFLHGAQIYVYERQKDGSYIGRAVTPAGTRLEDPYPVRDGKKVFAYGFDDGRIYAYERQRNGSYVGGAVTAPGYKFRAVYPVDNGAKLFACGVNDGRIYVLEHQENGSYPGESIALAGSRFIAVYPVGNGVRLFADGLDDLIYVYDKQEDGSYRGGAVTSEGIRLLDLHPADNGEIFFVRSEDDRICIYGSAVKPSQVNLEQLSLLMYIYTIASTSQTTSVFNFDGEQAVVWDSLRPELRALLIKRHNNIRVRTFRTSIDAIILHYKITVLKLWFASTLKQQLLDIFNTLTEQLNNRELSEQQLKTKLRALIIETKKAITDDSFGAINHKAAVAWKSFIRDMEKLLS